MKKLEDNFVPYDEALQLKELGFDEPCLMYYDYSWTLVESGVYECKAPLYQQAFGFFREKYNLSYLIAEYNKDGSLVISISKNRIEIFDKLTFFDINDYKEAELECLKQLILIANETNKNN